MTTKAETDVPFTEAEMKQASDVFASMLNRNTHEKVLRALATALRTARNEGWIACRDAAVTVAEEHWRVGADEGGMKTAYAIRKLLPPTANDSAAAGTEDG